MCIIQYQLYMQKTHKHTETAPVGRSQFDEITDAQLSAKENQRMHNVCALSTLMNERMNE